MAAPTIPYVIPGTVDHVANKPEIVCRVSFDSASAADPLSWVNVSDRLRSFQIDRGGENELELVDTGSATVVLDNSDRALDPFNTSSPYYPNVKPRRRLWLQGQFGGETKDLFYGWTGAFKPEWPSDFDNVVVLNAQDGFAIASGDALPTTSPPRDTYQDLVLFDKPWAYYPLNDIAIPDVEDVADSSRTGSGFVTTALLGDPLIVGDNGNSFDYTAVTGGFYYGTGVDFLPDAHAGGFTFELWWQPSEVGTRWLLAQGPYTSAALNNLTSVFQETTGTVNFALRTGAAPGANTTLTGARVLTVGSVYHIVCTYDGANMRVYVNGVQDASTAKTGTLPIYAAGDAGLDFYGGVVVAAPADGVGDDPAFYSYALPADRIAAHYTAGSAMGHHQAPTNQHIEIALEESGIGFLPRRLRTGQREIQPVYFTGQPPKEWIEQAVGTEGVPAMVFFAGDGAAVFLDRAHRSSSPWNTVQATFDDDGTDLPYEDFETDEGDAFIRNDVRVTAAGGELQQRTDATSIGEYQRQVLDRGETLNVDDTDAGAEADALLALFKDPLPRITSIQLAGETSGVLSQMIGRELGDKIRVFRRPSGGGSAIDQSCWIRKISLSGSADDPYLTCTWALAQR